MIQAELLWFRHWYDFFDKKVNHVNNFLEIQAPLYLYIFRLCWLWTLNQNVFATYNDFSGYPLNSLLSTPLPVQEFRLNALRSWNSRGKESYRVGTVLLSTPNVRITCLQKWLEQLLKMFACAVISTQRSQLIPTVISKKKKLVPL